MRALVAPAGAGLALKNDMADTATDLEHTPLPAQLLSLRAAGVPLHIDRSYVPAFIVTAIACGAGAYAVIANLSVTGALALGFAMAFGFSLSLLVHEFAHAHVARRSGIQIDYVRLFAGGAMCVRKDTIDAPAEQFRVAAAGLVASSVAGVAAFCLAMAATAFGMPIGISAMFWFLAFANTLIAVSNMLPVFPFDGSKLIHAMFWRKGRDQRAASEQLHRSGREFARITMVVGFLMMAFGGELFLGVFVFLFGLYLLRLPSPLR
jgi:Zn-dependent protease